MPSVPELHACLEELKTEIDSQRKRLETIEHDKILALRLLNAALDPVARLPLELSSEIFLHTVAPFPKPGARHIPMLLLNICHAWTEIALSTPALWAAIHISLPGSGLKELLPLWLERAYCRPLSIILEGYFDQAIVTAIGRYAQQVKFLEIRAVAKDWKGPSEKPDSTATAFRLASWQPLPLLDSLTIWGIENSLLSLRHIFNFLSLAPNLTELCFYCPSAKRNFKGKERIVLSKLRKLVFALDTTQSSDERILEHLSLPSLETLSLSYLERGGLLSLLRVSSPPLRMLYLENVIGTAKLVECLRLSPDLEHLEVRCTRYWLPETWLSALVESPCMLLHLSTLRIHLYFPDPDDLPSNLDSLWTATVRLLTARRTRLQTFQLTGIRRYMMPPPDIVSAFSELRVDGLQILIDERTFDDIYRYRTHSRTNMHMWPYNKF
ncbi:hypothetical protein C8R45DRAFT_507295 [Mycena sanguinolenta]|nr:hypothetical protein C8R45DRAFT_507295 [Mycena sanguinolenta]